MKKVEVQHNRELSPTGQRSGRGASLESPQGEQISRLEAMVNASPQTATQRRMAGMIHNSPQVAAQRQQFDSLAGETAQRAEAPAQPSAPIQFSPGSGGGRDEMEPGPGQGGAAPLTPRPGQGGQLPPQPPVVDSLQQDGYSPRGGEERDDTAQLAAASQLPQRKVAQCAEVSAKPNNTGLPDNLKSGIESLSGMSMDNVRVHYNSSQPAQLNALAYAQGTDIHVAPGQEKHLPHEAWHVLQQAQGRVRPTMQMKDGVPVNDDAGLEGEADVMGARALSVGVVQGKPTVSQPLNLSGVAQLGKEKFKNEAKEFIGPQNAVHLHEYPNDRANRRGHLKSSKDGEVIVVKDQISAQQALWASEKWKEAGKVRDEDYEEIKSELTRWVNDYALEPELDEGIESDYKTMSDMWDDIEKKNNKKY